MRIIIKKLFIVHGQVCEKIIMFENLLNKKCVSQSLLPVIMY